MKPIPKRKRAIELFASNSPFKPKVVASKRRYKRRPKNGKVEP